MTPLEAAWEAVLERPDDDRALHVLGDALLEIGDPLGELVELGLAPNVDLDQVHQYVATHARALLGGEESRLHLWGPMFERGFVVKATIGFRTELEVLLTLPIGRLLRELRVNEVPSAVLTTLKRTPARCLERLTLTGSTSTVDAPLPVAQLLATTPRLERLHLDVASLDWRDTTNSTLRMLGFELGARSFDMAGARLEALEALYLTLPFAQTRLGEELLSGEVSPRLQTLTIAGAMWPSQLELISHSALLPKLRALHLMGETATGWYPVLLQRVEAFRHLEKIAMRPDPNHPEWVTAVRELLPNATMITETPALPAS
ncbi:MAG: hypothetical protein JNM17_40210 [Archangium sp.]|nr:hypothetical protein [Archangium sp.]